MLSGCDLGARRRALIRVVVAIGAAVLLASCSLAPSPHTHFSSAEYGVPASPRVAFGSRIPKGGGRYMVGKPYRVAGRTYVPRDYEHYSATGLASWYGRDFHGRRTANGEVYDVADLTAAHPTLPLPSYARVTNLANGRSIVVRVNDRGPYTRNRLIDVSATVAAMLDFKRKGTARVKVDYIGPARMDGLDRKMLMATYQAPGQPASDTLVAAAPEIPRPDLVVASAPPLQMPKPTLADFSTDDEPIVLTPAKVARMKAAVYQPAVGSSGDLLGPLILRTGFSSSYAPTTNRFTPAQEAAASLADASTPDRAVQLGVFADPANAQRVAASFSRFGRIVTLDKVSGDRPVTVVQVVLEDSLISSDSVIAAASQAGLPGAALVNR